MVVVVQWLLQYYGVDCLYIIVVEVGAAPVHQ